MLEVHYNVLNTLQIISFRLVNYAYYLHRAYVTCIYFDQLEYHSYNSIALRGAFLSRCVVRSVAYRSNYYWPPLPLPGYNGFDTFGTEH